MNTYTTGEVAKIIGIHPNTVRMYEEWGLIPLAERKANGYRVFTDYHIEQLRLARIAFQIEVLQNGLRKKVVEIIKLSANKDFDTTIIQEKAESSMLGCVFGLMGAMYSGFLPVGMAIFGPLADMLPLQGIMVGSGIALVLVTAYLQVKSN